MAATAEPPTKRIKTDDYHYHIGGHNSSTDLEDNEYGPRTAAAVEGQLPCLSTSALDSAIEPARRTPESDTVCFGMIVLTLKNTMDSYRGSLDATTIFIRGLDSQLCVAGANSCVGVLEARDVQLFDLFHCEGIDTEIRLNVPKNANLPTQTLAEISVILYGLRELSSDLGKALQDLSLYLQDPRNAERDLPYWNPHRFFNPDSLRTSDWWHTPEEEGAKEELLPPLDFLEAFNTSGDLVETDGSSHLTTLLMSHQKEALTFLLGRERGWHLNGTRDIWTIRACAGSYQYINQVDGSIHDHPPSDFRGGILADTMGYGKTLEVISLIAHDASSPRKGELDLPHNSRTTLVVVPPAIVLSWVMELETHLKPNSVSWRCHAGKTKICQPRDIQDVDIVLITYNMLTSESRKPDSLIFAHQWHRVVLDEAHYIKNPAAASTQAAYRLDAERRWAVSGTPIQNNLMELQSLLRFLRVSPYSEKDVFNQQIVAPWKAGDGSESVARLRRLLNAIMLRRSNRNMFLPERTDIRQTLKLAGPELECYNKAKGKVRAIIDEALGTESQSNSTFVNALQKINALRMICNNGKIPSDLADQDERLVDSLDTPWNPDVGRKALADFPLLGLTLSCHRCSDPLDSGTQKGPPPLVHLTKCFRLHCSTCFEQCPKDRAGRAKVCDCQPMCPLTSLGLPARRTTSLAEHPNSRGSEYPPKMNALVRDLNKLPGDVKSIVFSFWTSTLDVCKEALCVAGIRCEQVDGTVKAKDREKIFSRFQANDDIKVLLLSLSCGAVGLTLTAASRVYLMEPQWNPSLEEQALARVHRIGQTKEVTTIRFIMEDTIETYVSGVVQQDKKDLVSVLLSSSGTSSRISKERLQELRNTL